MKQAVVIDGYSFVGFALCKRLLDQGVEVLLVNALDDDYLEEKQLSVGRNANLTEVNIEALSPLLEEEATVFIDGYSMFIKEIDMKQLLAAVLKENDLQQKRCIITMPMQWLQTGDKSRDWLKTLFTQQMIYYLPTVYGPFQPEEMLFQQKLMNESRDQLVSEKEWLDDAVYIDEVVKCILSDVLNNQESSEKIIGSGIENHWQQCVDLLQIKLKDHHVENAVHAVQSPEMIQVKDHLAIAKGLERQKKQLDIL